mgnify:CR=1 FL=1
MRKRKKIQRKPWLELSNQSLIKMESKSSKLIIAETVLSKISIRAIKYKLEREASLSNPIKSRP